MLSTGHRPGAKFVSGLPLVIRGTQKFSLASRIIISVGIAIPAASLCINRCLYNIASVRSATKTKAEKRRDVIVDLVIGLGIPFPYQICCKHLLNHFLYHPLMLFVDYINQGHCFNIFEDVGCWSFAYNTWVNYVLMSTPLLIIGLLLRTILSTASSPSTKAAPHSTSSSQTTPTSTPAVMSASCAWPAWKSSAPSHSPSQAWS